jgi:ribosomal protein S18 acetylase RimI-like enzyme
MVTEYLARSVAEPTPPEIEITLRFAAAVEQLDAVEPLWNALQEHHARLTPNLGGSTPEREPAEAWRRRRAKYVRWLEEPEAFFVIAEDGERPIGYAFVTVGSGYAAWQTGDRLAELETLSVLPEHRDRGVGTELLEAVWGRLAELGVEDLVITTAKTNVDSHRFYERHGFTQGFVVYYQKRVP